MIGMRAFAWLIASFALAGGDRPCLVPPGTRRPAAEHTPKFKVHALPGSLECAADMRTGNNVIMLITPGASNSLGWAQSQPAGRNSYPCHRFSQQFVIQQGQTITPPVTDLVFAGSGSGRRSRSASIGSVSESGSPMLEHVSVPVKSYERSKAFYIAVLQPLGYVLQRAYPPEAAGFMEGNHTSFWISRRRKVAKVHVAFLAKNRKEVQGFYKAAIEAGGKDNGKPGRRKGYGYAAFVFDPDGHNIEAVHFEKGDD